ncbi:hypothetical protein PT974_08212 [Cladobotryum mycophilum]|uniref:Uncharacterized protein n=1 Tax=Cladobotryum mycophilum TaxID=491253 RepID=A0ABR0SCR9_9HYPO
MAYSSRWLEELAPHHDDNGALSPNKITRSPREWLFPKGLLGAPSTPLAKKVQCTLALWLVPPCIPPWNFCVERGR